MLLNQIFNTFSILPDMVTIMCVSKEAVYATSSPVRFFHSLLSSSVEIFLFFELTN